MIYLIGTPSDSPHTLLEVDEDHKLLGQILLDHDARMDSASIALTISVNDIPDVYYLLLNLIPNDLLHL